MGYGAQGPLLTVFVSSASWLEQANFTGGVRHHKQRYGAKALDQLARECGERIPARNLHFLIKDRLDEITLTDPILGF